LDRLSAPLRADVRRLSSVLGDVISESGGVGLLEDVEQLRKAAIELRESRGPAAADRLGRVVELVDGFDLTQAESVARAFTVYFHLVNLAEERHRVRILRQRSRSDSAVAESLAATIGELRAELGDAGVDRMLARLEIRPVLTAHPTEARRRAVVDALRRISRVMDLLDDQRLSDSERADGERRLGEQVSILWRTSQLRRERPTPLDEVRSLMSIFDESLFSLVPVVYRELERALRPILPAAARRREGPRVPLFLRWGTWVGGDRDGNPQVTHEVTEAALVIQAGHVLLGLEAAARRIGRSLTLSAESTPPSEELRRCLHRAEEALGSVAQEVRAHSPAEPYGAGIVERGRRRPGGRG
jgi:phosphoenolpyruvate carboxylase